jgi:hypothetical protein
MRPLIFILFFVLVVGCKLSKKERLLSNDVDTLLNYNEEFVEKSEYEDDLSEIRSEMNLKIDSLKKLVDENPTFENKPFHIIVGSFTIETNAINYSKKIKEEGYDGNMLYSGGSYQMVTAKSYNNLRMALNDLEGIKISLTENAWVYISR